MSRDCVAARDDRRPGLPLRPDRDHRPVRVQRRARPRPGRSTSWTHALVRRARSPTRRSATRCCCRSRSRWRATALALLLGSLAALAVHRFRFFGRETISFLAGPAARAARASSPAWRSTRRSTTSASRSACSRSSSATRRSASSSSTTTSSRGCAARRRRSRRRRWTSAPTPGRRSATSRCPSCGTALLAGGLLAFALSFDEIIVTTFTAGHASQTLPIWILAQPPAAEPAADRQRRRGGPDPRCRRSRSTSRRGSAATRARRPARLGPVPGGRPRPLPAAGVPASPDRSAGSLVPSSPSLRAVQQTRPAPSAATLARPTGPRGHRRAIVDPPARNPGIEATRRSLRGVPDRWSG